MSHNGFGIGVGVVRIAEDNSLFEEIAEAPVVHAIQKTGWQVSAQLINRYLKYQAGFFRIRQHAVQKGKKDPTDKQKASQGQNRPMILCVRFHVVDVR
jgi:hypothetical protein